MPGYKNTIPQPNDDLSISQGDLLVNFQSLNSSFGIDHYPFTDITANDGKHNMVTTPIISPNSYPVTAASEPKLFAFAETQVGSTLPIGVIQYSRGPSNSVPTPITFLQSPSAPITLAAGGTTNVVDFTGLTDCQFVAYAAIVNFTGNLPLVMKAGHYYLTPAKKIRLDDITSSTITFVDLGNGILQLINNSAGPRDVSWSIEIIRIKP